MIEIPDKSNVLIDNQVFMKPDYLNHQYISGNKFRKLKYNLIEAKSLDFTSLITFGGAFSNHIAAVASAGKEYGFKAIGIIRGEELFDKIDTNPTLSFAKSCGMTFEFVSRELYRNKASDDFLKSLKEKYPDAYIVPEGGTNDLAIKGCQEILTEEDDEFDFICCAVGTGGTISGIINSSNLNQKILGFPALKGDFLKEDIAKFATQENWQLIPDYHFGGYAKINEELVTFINDFKTKFQIPLDPIYTGKMMFGIFDMIKKGVIPKEAKVLAIHTGGLQGIEGMNNRLKQKNLPLIT